MRTSHKNQDQQLDEGFTLIELLVVVLVIGILAAIAIPAFLSQREGAYAATLRSDVRQAAVAAEGFAAVNGTYVGLDMTALELNGFRPSDSVDLEIVPARTAFVITASSTAMPDAGTVTYSSDTGTLTD